MSLTRQVRAVLSTFRTVPSSAAQPVILATPPAAVTRVTRPSERGLAAREALLALFLLAGAAMPAHAATRTVSSLADSGAGTLRDQVAAAAAGDTIVFSVTGTIALTSGQIGIAKDLTISGPGAGSLTVRISAAANGESILSISSGTVNISGLTLSNGGGSPITDVNGIPIRVGGAIYMTGGTVTITSATLSNNSTVEGGAIYAAAGSLAILNSTVSNNIVSDGGGGITIRSGSLTVTASTISGNTAAYGGGIYNVGASATIKDSTISGNTVTGSNNGAGGGLRNSATMTVTNCTVSGNTSTSTTGNLIVGGGGLANFGTLTVNSSTITGNAGNAGGGLKNEGGTMSVSNSIVSGNTAYLEGPDIHGPVASGDYNLVGNSNSPLPGTHNIYGQPALLGPLANNGGPTLTHALQTGSPAYNAGDPAFDPTALPYDQRGTGFPRVKGGRIDIGAYESDAFQGGSSLVVTTLSDHDDLACGAEDCTLREAIRYAPSGATITFSVTGPIVLTGGELLNTGDVTVVGPAGVAGITISGNNITRILTVGGSTVNLSNLTLSGGNGVGSANTGNGGAILVNAGTLTLNNCTLSGNTASGSSPAGNGGAILNTNLAAVVIASNSTFSQNSATRNSGAITSIGLLTLSNCTVTGNSAGGLGGAINMGGGKANSITNSTFFGNTAATGGGISSTASNLHISNTIIAGNSAATAPDLNGSVTSGDYNLVQNTTGATFPASATHNITGQAPLLAPLANNGGLTQTMALQAGSPAIDAGDPAFDTTATPYDQRGVGYPRKVGSAIDIGAFEVQPTVTLSLSGSPMAESAGVATVTATLSNTSGSPVTVNLAFSGSATPSTDYVASGSSIVIPAGSTMGSITLTAVQDSVNEPIESIVVAATTVTNGTLPAPQQVTATIADDDPLPTLAINSVSQPEGNAGTTNFVFTVTLSGATAQTVSVNYATANGTAVAPGDYAATSGTLTFSPGVFTQTITVPVAGDAVNEADETFTVGLSGPTLATISAPTGTGTIQNDDAASTLAIDNVTQSEGTGGTTNYVFTVTMTGTTAQTVTVNYATADGSATAPADYAARSGTLTFTPGVLTQTITVPVVADAVNEPDETFTVGLSGPTVATVTSATGTGTILNDDALPTLAIDNVTQPEGTGGTTNFVFTVTMTGATSQTVTVNYATADGSAIAPADYAATSGTLTFTPGVLTQTITVPVVGDALNETGETFTVGLSGATIASVTAGTGTGTITNDDAVPALSISSPSQVEGSSGTSPMTFVVTLSSPSGQTVTVDYSTANGTATAGSDYSAASGTLTFTPGVTSRNLSVLINGDTVDEPSETFTVSLATPGNATISSATGTGSILNDDGAPTLSVNSPSQTEGDSGTTVMTFVVTLSPSSGQTVTVNYATANGAAAAGSDYTATSGTLTFGPGVTTQTIAVPVIGDGVNEPDETFTVTLSAAVNASITTATGTGTIVNDDGATAPSILSVGPAEGPTTGGQSVTLTGTNLQGATSVTFGGVAGTITASTATSITVITPAHAAGPVDIVITAAGGTTTSPNAYTFAAAAASPTGIPTLSGWMLLVAMSLLAAVGLGRLRL